jgi:hypothetical protein
MTLEILAADLNTINMVIMIGAPPWLLMPIVGIDIALRARSAKKRGRARSNANRRGLSLAAPSSGTGVAARIEGG